MTIKEVVHFMRVGQFAAYKDLIGSIEYEAKDDCFYGKILNIDDLVCYQGATIVELGEECHKAIDKYLSLKEQL